MPALRIYASVPHSPFAGTTWQLYGQDTVMLGQLMMDLAAAVKAAPDSKRELWSSAFTNLTDGQDGHTAEYYGTVRRKVLAEPAQAAAKLLVVTPVGVPASPAMCRGALRCMSAQEANGSVQDHAHGRSLSALAKHAPP
jgi:hypothetical protein